MTDWKQDAELAGSVHKKPKPYVAMLVARCVEPDNENAVRYGRATKCSVRGFAQESGINHQTIAKYLSVWDHMAEQGTVEDRKNLAPGQDTKVPDQTVWSKAYREVYPPKPKVERAASKDEVQEVTGVDRDNKRVTQFADRLDKYADEVRESDSPLQIQFKRAVAGITEALAGISPERNMVQALDALAEIGTIINERN